jgi:peptidyl-prolyl cis-trans isomerase B (cyclophilin B)
LKKFLKLSGILMLMMTMVFTFAACGGSSNTEEPAAEEPAAQEEQAAEPAAEPIGIHHAEIVIKDYGTVKVELDGDTAPITVQNFMDLANQGFYDGLTFHRIMEGFMIQGGDPNGDGTGGSDQNIKGEFAANGVNNPISHVRGVISMARAQDPDSASSQFFIVQEDSEFLDGQYAAFGHVTEGMEFVDIIAKEAKPVDDNGTIPAEEQPVIETIKIID